MIGLVMAGGKGSRMQSIEEKLLLKYHKPVIIQVVDAMKSSQCFSKIIVATSPYSPKTKKVLVKNEIEVFDTPGKGYSHDLNYVLQSIDEVTLVVSGDQPLLDDIIIKKIVNQDYKNKLWTSYLVTKEFLDSLDMKSCYPISYEGKECYFTGVSAVEASKISKLQKVEENYIILNDRRIAFNLNTKEDYSLLHTA